MYQDSIGLTRSADDGASARQDAGLRCESEIRDHIPDIKYPKVEALISACGSYRTENTASNRGIAREPESPAGL